MAPLSYGFATAGESAAKTVTAAVTISIFFMTRFLSELGVTSTEPYRFFHLGRRRDMINVFERYRIVYLLAPRGTLSSGSGLAFCLSTGGVTCAIEKM
jgi:hypothetical protein